LRPLRLQRGNAIEANLMNLFGSELGRRVTTHRLFVGLFAPSGKANADVVVVARNRQHPIGQEIAESLYRRANRFGDECPCLFDKCITINSRSNLGMSKRVVFYWEFEVST
jgi:hypothetical protein